MNKLYQMTFTLASTSASNNKLINPTENCANTSNAKVYNANDYSANTSMIPWEVLH